MVDIYGKVECHPASITVMQYNQLYKISNKMFQQEQAERDWFYKKIKSKMGYWYFLYAWFLRHGGDIVEYKSLEVIVENKTKGITKVGKWKVLVNWLLKTDLPKYLESSELKITVYVDIEEKLNKLIIDQYTFWFRLKQDCQDYPGNYEKEENFTEKKAIRAIVKIIEILLRYQLEEEHKYCMCLVDKEGNLNFYTYPITECDYVYLINKK